MPCGHGGRVRLVPIALIVAVLAAGCTSSSTKEPGPTDFPTSRYAFAAPLELSPAPDGHGSEPGILVARDGAIYAVSVLGSADARGDGVWRSDDDGATWTYLAKADYPFGGGDADLDEDDEGTIYLTGQWRPAAIPGYYVTGGESVAVSRDRGQSWTTNPVASNAPVTDRQWLVTHGVGHAWLAFNQAQRGLVVTHSTDSGLTWGAPVAVAGTWEPGDGVAVAGGPNGIPSDPVADGDGTLFFPYGPGIGGGSRAHRIFVSSDQGQTFTERVVHVAREGEQAAAIFGSLSLDSAGGLNYVWAESQGGGSQGVRVWFTRSVDEGATWSLPVSVTPPGMTAVFPWVVAGDAGRVAVTFYAAVGTFLSDEAPTDQAWFPAAAFSTNAFGENASFSIASMGVAPNHEGPICTGGTGCDASFRLLGDFFESSITADGRLVAVWADDTQPQRRTFFSIQEAGPRLHQASP